MIKKLYTSFYLLIVLTTTRMFIDRMLSPFRDNGLLKPILLNPPKGMTAVVLNFSDGYFFIPGLAREDHIVELVDPIWAIITQAGHRDTFDGVYDIEVKSRKKNTPPYLSPHTMMLVRQCLVDKGGYAVE